jgi:disulfide bond formation protein DsbB
VLLEATTITLNPSAGVTANGGGGGDCTKIDWTFLGGSIANWSFVAFMAMAVWMVVFAFLRYQQQTQSQ